MNFIRTLILKYLFGSQVKNLLDKLPFDGKKTVIAMVSTCLAVLIFVGLGSSFSIEAIMQFVTSLGAEPILSSADIAALVGAMATLLTILHKVLKALEKIR